MCYEHSRVYTYPHIMIFFSFSMLVLSLTLAPNFVDGWL